MSRLEVIKAQLPYGLQRKQFGSNLRRHSVSAILCMESHNLGYRHRFLQRT